MSSYENAPATKLLNTVCALCGRALVDAKSIERGVGPDCAREHGYGDAEGPCDTAAATRAAEQHPEALDALFSGGSNAHDSANGLVFLVAKKANACDPVLVRAVVGALAALGYVKLSAKIADRLKNHIAPVMDVSALRKEYADTRAHLMYTGATKAEIDAAVRALGATTPAEFVAKLALVSFCCCACNGTGTYKGLSTGTCYRCEGKGEQDLTDARRNWTYDSRTRSNHGQRAA